MKPDFALSLSQEGIALFHRTADGWDEVGKVPLDSADLVGDLAGLREEGLALGPALEDGRLPCKIVIPNDLVRYIALDNPRADAAEVRTALEGATPYSLAEIVHDHRAGGGRTHIAAVARSNLEEAEVFASEHGFAPLSFVATPEPFTFPGEVHFGPTRMAATILPQGDGPGTSEADEECVPITPLPFASETSVAQAAEPTAAPLPAEQPVPDPKAAADARDDGNDIGTTKVTAPPTDIPATDAGSPEQPLSEPDTTEPATASEPAPPTAPKGDDRPEDGPDSEDDDNEETKTRDEKAAATPVFASRSRPEVTGAPPPPRASTAPPAPLATRPDAEPVFASRALRADKVDKDIAASTRRHDPTLDSPAPAVTAVSATDTSAPQIAVVAGAGKAPPLLPVRDAPPGDEQRDATILPLAAASGTAQPKIPGQHAARGIDPAKPITDTPPTRPRRARIGLGLMLTLLLLAVLAAIAFWSTTLEGGLAAIFGSDDRQPGIAARESVSADPAAPAVESAEIETSELAASIEPGPAIDSQSPEMTSDTEDAGPGVTALSTADPIAPRSEAPGLEAYDSVPEDMSTLSPEVQALEADSSGTHAPLASEAESESVETDAGDGLAEATGVGGGTLITPEEADRVYAATGVWLRAPRLPLMPREGTLEDMTQSMADPSLADRSPIALAEGSGMSIDSGLPVQPDPPPAGTTISRDSRGLIVATPDGVLLPTGITVFASAPPRVPPTRPGTPPPPPAVEAAVMVTEAGIRPPVRPDTILQAAVAAGAIDAAATGAEDSAEPSPTDDTTESNETPDEPGEDTSAGDDDSAHAADAPPGGVALALAAPDLRPVTRPASIIPPPSWDGRPPPNRPAGFASLVTQEDTGAAEPATADPLEDTLNEIASGPDPMAGVTANAVPRALRPDLRPRNFDRVVQTQTELLARASTAAPATAPETAPAAAPAGGTTTQGLTAEEAAEASAEVSTISAPATGPTPGGVAEAATVSRAVNLREINLIGVFGPQSARRALVRLSNGRLVRVGVGDSLDGGQVVAIGDGILNYSKRGQTYSLRVPG